MISNRVAIKLNKFVWCKLSNRFRLIFSCFVLFKCSLLRKKEQSRRRRRRRRQPRQQRRQTKTYACVHTDTNNKISQKHHTQQATSRHKRYEFCFVHNDSSMWNSVLCVTKHVHQMNKHTYEHAYMHTFQRLLYDVYTCEYNEMSNSTNVLLLRGDSGNFGHSFNFYF